MFTTPFSTFQFFYIKLWVYELYIKILNFVAEIKRIPMNLAEFERHVIDLHSNSDYLFSEEYGVRFYSMLMLTWFEGFY